MTEDETPPHRVVDGYGQGWFFTSSGTYEADFARNGGLISRGPARARPEGPHGAGWTYDDLAQRRGPLRHVVQLPKQHAAELDAALHRAGDRAAASVLLALYAVRRNLADTHGNADLLIAGRAGSWESVTATELADMYGPALYATPEVWDEHTAHIVAGTLLAWVTSPSWYVEVAENLAAAFGRVTDAAGGWDQVANEPLRQDERLRNLLTSTSEGYWKGRL